MTVILLEDRETKENYGIFDTKQDAKRFLSDKFGDLHKKSVNNFESWFNFIPVVDRRGWKY